MDINLITLNTKGRVDFEISPDLSEYYNEDVKDIQNLKVTGTIIDNSTLEYEIKLNITGTLVLRSAINGNDVFKNIDIKYDDFINNLVEIYKNSSNTLDILPIIWENILLEIPIRAVNSEDMFESVAGDGWEVVSEED